jgi:hypothetical protein
MLLLAGCGPESSVAHEVREARGIDAAGDSPGPHRDAAPSPPPAEPSPAPEAGQAGEAGVTEPPGTPIDPADVLVQAQADRPLSDGEWNQAWNTQCMNRYLNAHTPELEYPDGITGPELAAGGGTLRFGKTEPGAERSLQFVTAPGDPTTSGRKRCELKGANVIVYGQVYWVAFRIWIDDWTDKVDPAEAYLFGTQIHTGNTADTSPVLSLVGYGRSAGQFQVASSWQANPSIPGTWDTPGSIGTWKSEPLDLPFNQWLDFVIRFKTDIGSSSDPADGEGFVEVWMNDGPAPIASRHGKVGYETGVNDYPKFGYYNWSSAFPALSNAHWRKLLMRSPILVKDNGAYTKDDLLRYIREH